MVNVRRNREAVIKFGRLHVSRILDRQKAAPGHHGWQGSEKGTDGIKGRCGRNPFISWHSICLHTLQQEKQYLE